MKCVSKRIEMEYHEFDGDIETAAAFAGSHQVDVDYWIPNVVAAEDFMTDPGNFVGALWVSGVNRWVGLRVGDFILNDGGVIWPVDRTKFYKTFDIVPEPKVEVHVSGVVTSSDIERAIGRSIQQSSRFR